MERALSNSERIKRAEAVAYRRRLNENRKEFEKINYNKGKSKFNLNEKANNDAIRRNKLGIFENEAVEDKPNHRKMSRFTKFSIQVISSICIFGIVYYLGQNYNEKMQNVKNFFDKDTDFSTEAKDVYNVTKSIFTGENINYWKDKLGNWNLFSGFGKNQSDNEISKGEDENSTNTDENNIEKTENNAELNGNNANVNIADNNENTQIAGIGGGGETEKTSENEDDVTYIKNHVSFVKPLENGTITSRYGEREATEIVSANHKGVDIGAEYGSEIKSAMSGKVTLVSEYGDYGKHVEITDNEVSTLYAHCSNIIVKEGDYVEKGQKIAEVGSTGRSTGPHLHFEIRRNGVCVNPEEVLSL